MSIIIPNKTTFTRIKRSNEEYSEQTPLIRSQNGHIKHSDDGEPFKFRFFLCGLLVWGIFIHLYESKTLAVASVKMVSSNALASELTDLKVGILASEIFGPSFKQNAALEGTCPIMVSSSFAKPSYTNRSRLNLSIKEGISLVNDLVQDVVQDIDQGLNEGQLVNWTTKQRGWILAAQPVGALLGVLPLSRLGFIYGSQLIITIAFLSASLHPFLLPYIVLNCPFWFILLSEFLFAAVSEGSSAVLFPFLTTWLLPEELAAIIAIFMFGQSAAVSFASFISSELLAVNVDWQWCLYIPGILMFITSVVWIIFSSERPLENGFISTRERDLIMVNSVMSLARQREMSNLRDLMDNREEEQQQQEAHRCICQDDRVQSCPAYQIKRTPIWNRFFTDPTLWALIVANFAFRWRAELWTLLPTFFATILHMDPANVGAVISFKGLVAIVYGFAFAVVAKRYELNRPFGCSKTTYRKLAYLAANATVITSSILTIAFDCSPLAMVLSVIILPVCSGFYSISGLRIPVDLSPEDSGLIFSYVRLLSPGDSLSVPAASYILSSSNSPLGNRQTWSYVWGTALVIDLFSCVIFTSFVRTDPKNFSKLTQVGPCQMRRQSRES